MTDAAPACRRHRRRIHVTGHVGSTYIKSVEEWNHRPRNLIFIFGSRDAIEDRLLPDTAGNPTSIGSRHLFLSVSGSAPGLASVHWMALLLRPYEGMDRFDFERPKHDKTREETRRLNRRAALVVNLQP